MQYLTGNSGRGWPAESVNGGILGFRLMSPVIACISEPESRNFNRLVLISFRRRAGAREGSPGDRTRAIGDTGRLLEAG